jgi:hypothetical protein
MLSLSHFLSGGRGRERERENKVLILVVEAESECSEAPPPSQILMFEKKCAN